MTTLPAEQGNQLSDKRPGLAPFRASAALDVDQDQMWYHLERGTPVRLISTFENLITAYPDELISTALDKAQPLDLDFLPVRERESGSIVALFSAKKPRSTNATTVSDCSDQLSGQNLIAADTSLLHFVYEADTCPCRLILDEARITGLVTVSDMQKLPVRMALFSLFIHLEILLTQVLRHHLGTADPFVKLSPCRAKLALEKWEKFKTGNVAQDRLTAVDFCDKRMLLRKIGIKGISSGLIERELTAIESLRNPIAHGADYAESQEAAFETARRARLVRDWIGRLREELRAILSRPSAAGQVGVGKP